ncbi:MAG: hypothetical protein M0D57_14445 [Sphingobacteriales bacterium JAD_PAG50586_3]|nr:MAG: hypothetical protein M0D57_14445 [Sphingobacteriales bacterium JAD_PAG50586_3]
MIVIISNILTSTIGLLLFDKHLSGGYLLDWLPVYYYRGHIRELNNTISIFIEAFLLTLTIESAFNYFLLRKEYTFKKIVSGTFWVNLFTYIVAAGLFVLLVHLGALVSDWHYVDQRN